MERTEEIEQARLIKWSHKREVRSLMPELAWLFHVPNGGQRSSFAGAQMKALGARRGVPDLLMPFSTLEYNGLIIEMKSATGSTSKEQKEWLAHFDHQGWAVHIARSAEEARQIICEYLGMPSGSVPSIDA